MRSLFLSLLPILLLTSCASAQGAVVAEKKSSMPWFVASNFKSMEIRDYDSLAGKKLRKSIKIDDAVRVAKFVEMVKAIDPNGNMMVKPGPSAALRELIFVPATGDSETIRIISNKIKTPSTAFHSETSPQETRLLKEVDHALNP